VLVLVKVLALCWAQLVLGWGTFCKLQSLHHFGISLNISGVGKMSTSKCWKANRPAHHMMH